MSQEKDFYESLGAKESSNNYQAENDSTRYIGKYQMGESALVDVGYYTKPPKEGQKDGTQYNNDWKGTWTGKNGVNSLQDFKNNGPVQEKAVREYHQTVWNSYLEKYHQYEGHDLNGAKLTKSGMIGYAHLVGAGSLKKYIDSKGEVDKSDQNVVRGSSYLRDLAGQKVDWSQNTLTPQTTENVPDSQKQADVEAANVKVQPPNVNGQIEEAKTGDAVTQPSATNNAVYTVNPGDSLTSIANAQGKTVEELITIPGNEKFQANPDLIHPGRQNKYTYF